MGLTSIEWADYTFNAWLGCSKVSPACLNCYITTTTPFRVRKLEHGDPRQRTAPPPISQHLIRAARNGHASRCANAVAMAVPMLVRCRCVSALPDILSMSSASERSSPAVCSMAWSTVHFLSWR